MAISANGTSGPNQESVKPGRCARYWQLSESLRKESMARRNTSLYHTEREAAAKKCDEIRLMIAAHLKNCQNCQEWLFEVGIEKCS